MLFQFGGFSLDDQRLALAGPDGPIHVEPQVFELLRYLVEHRDRVVPKEELLDQVWGDRFVSESALTSRVKAARRAIGDDGQSQRVIKTVHGRGYHFVAPVEVATPTSGGRRVLARPRTEPIGREDDIAGLIRCLEHGRLVTIAGSGGAGKTTVALTVAHQLQVDLPDGAVFIDLVPVPPGGDLTRAVADAAGVEGDASASLAAVAEHLAHRRVLVVLDNCEHVLPACLELVEHLVVPGGEARVLATSREPLRMAGEQVWPLGPLGGAGPVLFVERARAAEPRIDWQSDDPRVVDLCQRLDNLPLALELAAGQLRRFDLDDLARDLDDRLSLLSAPARADGQRHATMEATIDWSYRLLAPTEQALLRHLSVFPATFDLRAVEGSAPTLPGAVPTAVLGELVDKSLVVRQPGEGRYRLLETIRLYGRNLLEEAGEATEALDRYRRHVRHRARSTARLDRWFSARLAADHRAGLEDARLGFRLSLDVGDVEGAVEIATSAPFLWRNAVGGIEGQAWVDQLLPLPMSARDRLWVHIVQADVGQGRGDARQVSEAASAAQPLLDEVNDPAGTAITAHHAAMEHLTDPDRAAPGLAHALELAHAAADPRLVTLTQAFLAVADILAGRLDQARQHLIALETGASEDGYDRFIVHWAGWMRALAQHDAIDARSWMSAQQDFLDRTGIKETWITSYSTTMCRIIEGDDVREPLGRVLLLADREGYRAEADCVLALAYAELCADRPEAAAELVGTATRNRFNATAHYVLYRAVLHRPLRALLDEATLREAMARGRPRRAADELARYGIERLPA